MSAVLPASYIFDGMRAILLHQAMRLDLLMVAGVLNLFWLAAGVLAFLMFYQAARQRGTLLQLGE